MVKPTDGMAGRGIMLLRPDDPNLRYILETATGRGRHQVVVQRFLPESAEGDRRVIVLDGAPIGVVRRIAGEGEFRCNMATGVTVVADTVTPRDKEICARIADQLAAHGLVFVGIDVIGRYLTEINVTSPTGVREIDAFAGTRRNHPARMAPCRPGRWIVLRSGLAGCGREEERHEPLDGGRVG